MQYPEGDQSYELDLEQNDCTDDSIEIVEHTYFDPGIEALMIMFPGNFRSKADAELKLASQAHKIAKEEGITFDIAEEPALVAVMNYYKLWRQSEEEHPFLDVADMLIELGGFEDQFSAQWYLMHKAQSVADGSRKKSFADALNAEVNKIRKRHIVLKSQKSDINAVNEQTQEAIDKAVSE